MRFGAEAAARKACSAEQAHQLVRDAPPLSHSGVPALRGSRIAGPSSVRSNPASSHDGHSRSGNGRPRLSGSTIASPPVMPRTTRRRRAAAWHHHLRRRRPSETGHPARSEAAPGLGGLWLRLRIPVQQADQVRQICHRGSCTGAAQGGPQIPLAAARPFGYTALARPSRDGSIPWGMG
jgi:hypothetical protein